MAITINGQLAAVALQPLLQRLLAIDPQHRLHNGDINVTAAEAQVLLNRNADTAIDGADLTAINQKITDPAQQLSAIELAQLANEFHRAFPYHCALPARSLFAPSRSPARLVVQVPSVEFSAKDRTGASFAARTDATAPDRIVIYSKTFPMSDTEARRAFTHELIHQRWNALTPSDRQRIITTMQSAYGVEQMKAFLFSHAPIYQQRYALLLMEQGEAIANENLVNECVAFLLSYEMTPGDVALVNEPPSTEKKRLIQKYGSVEAVEQIFAEAGKPWHAAATEEDLFWLNDVDRRSTINNEQLENAAITAHHWQLPPLMLTMLADMNMIPAEADVDTVVACAHALHREKTTTP